MKKNSLQIISLILLIAISSVLHAQKSDTTQSNQVSVQNKLTSKHLLKGTILNIAKNERLFGANVVLKGTTLGATTDEKGYFEIAVDDTTTNNILIITYLGYEDKELEIKDWTKELRIGVIEGNSNLDEIVVTSRRRNEEAQDIPIPITVIGANQIENSGSFNVNRVKELIPSVQLYSSNPRNTSLNIRGLGTTFGLSNDGLDPGVGFYVDGVYYARPAATTLDFVDIQQIEVLRGPQGTLFGKNTTAGAFNITTRKPTFIRQ